MNSFTRQSTPPESGSTEGIRAGPWPQRGEFGLAQDMGGGPAAQGQNAAGLRLAVLARAIEHEIIPRLMLAHRTQHDCLTLPALTSQKISSDDVREFAKLVVSSSDGVAHACVEALRMRGIAVESIYLDLLAPVARHLGELWEQDLCDFTEVTVGLGRLQQVLRELSPAFDEATAQAGNGRRVLLLPAPGQQHTFGLVMVAEFFRRAGWDVAGGGWEAGADSEVMVRQEWFDVVGFSLGSTLQLDDLAHCIRAVRKATLNPQMGIMVGGPVFVQHPEYGAVVDADAVATDGRQAIELAEQLVSGKPRSGSACLRASQTHP